MPETTETREQLIRLLKKHDWMYERADDRRRYSEGEQSLSRIRSLVAQVADGEELYDIYCRKAYGV